jgi:hypothetical protein
MNFIKENFRSIIAVTGFIMVVASLIQLGTIKVLANATDAEKNATQRLRITSGVFAILGIFLVLGVSMRKAYEDSEWQRRASQFSRRSSLPSISRRSSGNSYRTQTNSLRAESIRDLQDM